MFNFIEYGDKTEFMFHIEYMKLKLTRGLGLTKDKYKALSESCNPCREVYIVWDTCKLEMSE